jgi:ribosomal protein L17
MNRKDNGLLWELRIRFYSGGLPLGVYQLKAVDYYPEKKQIDNPFKTIKDPKKEEVATKGMIMRKLRYAEKTNTPVNLTKKEWNLKAKLKIPTPLSLAKIEDTEANSKKSREFVEKLKSKKRNVHLTEKKNYEDLKTERIEKKMIKEDKKKVKMLEKHVQDLIEDSKDEKLRITWERMKNKSLSKPPLIQLTNRP